MSHTNIIRKSFAFTSGAETLAADLVLPDGPGPFPGFLNIAGTGSWDRFGDGYSPTGAAIKGGRDRWVSERLARAGFAGLFWDKRGVGESTGGDREPGDPPGNRDSYTDVLTDVQDAESALKALADRPEVDPARIGVMGHSAGVYFACLLAERTDVPATYIFSGGVYRRADISLSYMFDLVRKYIGDDEERRAFAEKNSPWSYWAVHHWDEVLEAIHRGDEVFVRQHGDFTFEMYLRRHRMEVQIPREMQFRHVKAPTMVVHGEYDYFVPPKNAYWMAGQIRENGNRDVAVAIIPRTDHGWRLYPHAAGDEELMRDILSGGSGGYPWSELKMHTIVGWLKDRLVVSSPA
ncbi:MAG: prolyl oligopeptidase family serine peptidase [Anaerolineales bacterium]|nr:prolyl oligopeptidase family serine peptidase [Anaerolineales bacterium]